MLDWALPGAVGFLATALLFVAYRRLSLRPQGEEAQGTGRLPELSLAAYAPMARILSRQDLDFLASSGLLPSRRIGQFRKERARSFAGYLSRLKADFQAIDRLGRELVACGALPPETVQQLVEQRWRFTCAVWALHASLLVYRLGWDGLAESRVNVALDALRFNLRAVVQPSAA